MFATEFATFYLTIMNFCLWIMTSFELQEKS